jgi:hypothetical protein
METAILAIISLLALGLWCDNWRIRKTVRSYRDSAEQSARVLLEQQACADLLRYERNMLLEQKHPTPAPKESPFADRDKIPATGKGRYVPIGSRRQAAELASLGPQTHDTKVRENNAKAMERAG